MQAGERGGVRLPLQRVDPLVPEQRVEQALGARDPAGEPDQAVRARRQAGAERGQAGRRRRRDARGAGLAARRAARRGTAPRAGTAGRSRAPRPSTRNRTYDGASGSTIAGSPQRVAQRGSRRRGRRRPSERSRVRRLDEPPSQARSRVRASGQRARRTRAGRPPRRRRRPPPRRAARSRRPTATRCSRGRRSQFGSSQPAGSRSTRLTPPHPMVMTASAGCVDPDAGLATIRVTTTDFTAVSRIASVDVDVYGSGSRSSPGVLVGVQQHDPRRREHDDAQVPAHLVAVEGRLVVHVERHDLLVGQGRRHGVGDDLRVVARVVDRGPQVAPAVTVLGRAERHPVSLSRRPNSPVGAVEESPA